LLPSVSFREIKIRTDPGGDLLPFVSPVISRRAHREIDGTQDRPDGALVAAAGQLTNIPSCEFPLHLRGHEQASRSGRILFDNGQNRFTEGGQPPLSVRCHLGEAADVEVIHRIRIAILVKVHAFRFAQRLAAQPLAGHRVVVAVAEISQAGFLVAVFGRVAPRVGLGGGAGGVDEFTEGTVGVAGEESPIAVGQGDDMTGAVVERIEVGGGAALRLADEEQAAGSACRTISDVRTPDVFPFEGRQPARELVALVNEVPAVPDEGDSLLGYAGSVAILDDVLLEAPTFGVVGEREVPALGSCGGFGCGDAVLGAGSNKLVLRVPAVIPLGGGLAVAGGVEGEAFVDRRDPHGS